MDIRMKEFTEAFPEIVFRENEMLSQHTTFRIGGPCALYAEPADETQFVRLFHAALLEGICTFVIGRGSNLLVSDKGFEGLMISTAGLDQIACDGSGVLAGAGVPLSRLAVFAMRQGLGGAEFCHGIPGSLGGAVFMNAGAYTHSMADILTEVRMIENGEVITLPVEQMEFGYRRSRAMRLGGIVLSARMRLVPDNEDSIGEKMRTLDAKRSEKQPLEFPSAGSFFKRPEGYYAGALIEQAGLKGLTVGGAQVSEKHAGFIINRGGASCADVLALQNRVIKRVERMFHVRLEREVQTVGDELL